MILRYSFLCVLLLVLRIDARAQGSSSAELFAAVTQHVTDRENSLIDLRHEIHRHPELSGAEARTAGKVAARLKSLGLKVHTEIGGHGVVGILKGGKPGPTVAFRADMDAVRSADPDPAEYRSEVPGVRHICGHDIHTVIGVGIAEGFARHRDEIAGTVMLIFQPAEETGTGAKAMISDGVFDILRPDAIFAVHTAPYNVGQVATVSGGMMAGRARLRVSITGDGDLDAAADKVRSTIARVGTLSPTQSGQVAPHGFILVQIFSGTAGSSGNERLIRGQVMTAGLEDRMRAKTKMLAALESLHIPGATITTEYDEGFMEGVNNDDEIVTIANNGVNAFAPEIEIRTVSGAVPAFSEDFGSFQAEVPGMMYFLGVSNPENGTVGMPHSPDYVADDSSIVIGIRTIASAMLQYMDAHQSEDNMR